MQGINARKVSLPYADPGFFFFFFFFGGGGGVQACLPENNPDILFSPQLQYFTIYSYREEVRDPCMPPYFLEADSRGWGTHIFSNI